MDRFDRRLQRYINVDSALEAEQAGADCVQVKYDGWWSRIVVNGGQGSLFSRQGVLKSILHNVGEHPAVLLGEYLVGTQRATSAASFGQVMVFDFLGHDYRFTSGVSWEERHRLATNHCNSIHPLGRGQSPFVVAPYWPISQAEFLWREHVESGNAEGLVYRRLGDPYEGSAIWRQKRVFTMDYVITGVEEGAGTRNGMAGALIGSLFCPNIQRLVPVVRIGGGFNHAEATDMFRNFGKYSGRVLEVKGWQLFASGALRHPNAVRGEDGQLRWRDDKTAEECLAPDQSKFPVILPHD